MSMKVIGNKSTSSIESTHDVSDRPPSPQEDLGAAKVVDEAKARALATPGAPCGISHIFGKSGLTPQGELAMKVLLAAAALAMPHYSDDLNS